MEGLSSVGSTAMFLGFFLDFSKSGIEERRFLQGPVGVANGACEQRKSGGRECTGPVRALLRDI